MPIAELDDEEDWYDDEYDHADDPDHESAPCPECGETVHVITGKCSACGYWLSDADRQAMWTADSKPLWLKVTAVIVLVALLTGIVVGVF
jgi:ribosomal protein L37E